MLVAELVDEEARTAVEQFADARRTVIVPLLDPPVDASLHVLEVSTPGHDEPLLVLAEPAGAPTERGYPLRLHPYGSLPDVLPAAPPSSNPIPALRAKRARTTTLTARHARALGGEPASATSSPDQDENLVGRELAGGKYVVEALIGAGGMGAVYRARHSQLGTQLAVKVLHEQFRRDIAFCSRFQAEALAISQLDHANVIRIIDYGQEPDGLLYLAMDFLRGIELEEVIQDQGALPLARILDIAIQVTAGLGHAHARGIIHRDVKPSNIVLVKSIDDEGRAIEIAKVCDFGIAAQAGARGLVGTPAYMSPEQCEAREVDGRTDIYALGVILFELATGRLPFLAESSAKIAEMHLHQAPPRPSLIRPLDANLETLILRMMRKVPSERPACMRDVRGLLRQIASNAFGKSSTGSGERKSTPPSTAAPGSASRTAGTRGAQAADVYGFAARLAQDPGSVLGERLAHVTTFEESAPLLAAAMRVLLDRKQYAPLTRVIALLKTPQVGFADARIADLVMRVVRTLEDPASLRTAAEDSLSTDDEDPCKLLASLGLAAAHAVYAARVRARATPSMRARFVATLRAMESSAWPLVALALERNAPGGTNVHDPRLAEDLLRAMVIPPNADAHAGARSTEAVGSVVAAHVRWGDPAVRRVATDPLARLWGDRARALLLGLLLNDTEDDVRIAALASLRDLDAIDEHVVRRVEPMLGPADSHRPALQAAVADALAHANADAVALADAVLRRTLGNRRRTKMHNTVTFAIAHALVAIGGPGGSAFVESFGRQCEEPLRSQIAGLVRTR